MAELLCPNCSTTRVEPLRIVLLRRYGIAALATFFVGMILMLLFGVFRSPHLGAALWIILTLVPAGLLAHEWHTHRHDALYQRGYACTYCGNRWLPELEAPPRADPEIKDRLRALEEQHRGSSPPRTDL